MRQLEFQWRFAERERHPCYRPGWPGPVHRLPPVSRSYPRFCERCSVQVEGNMPVCEAA